MIIRSIHSIIEMLDADYIEQGDLNKMVHGVAIDSHKVVTNQLFVPINGVNFNAHRFVEEAINNGAVCVLWNRRELNPPKNVVVILVDDTTSALQQLAKAYRLQLNAKIVGITGSNGKTSTKDILGAICKEKYFTQKTRGNYNNEIGVPLTLLEFSDNLEVGIVEMGMEHQKEIAFLSKLVEPDIAIISSVGTAHLENLGSIENIVKAKMEILDGLNKTGVFIYNNDNVILDHTVKRMNIAGSIKVKTFGVSDDCDYQLGSVEQDEEGINFEIVHEVANNRLAMYGVHNAYNALAAFAAAKALGINNKMYQRGLVNVRPTAWRNELLKCGKASILNDAYKSNPQSAMAALETLKAFKAERKIVVFADMLDLGIDTNMMHYQLGKEFGKYDIEALYTFGDIACYIAQGALNSNSNLHVEHIAKREALVDIINTYTRSECIILIKGSRGLHLDEVVNEVMMNCKRSSYE